MTVWPAPPVPQLPGRGLPVRLTDTATGRLAIPATGRIARMYVCGITPYDATHLGHASTYVTFDLLNRVWRDSGHQVRYVQNVTDIDDPLLERANATGVDWRELADSQIDLFFSDMEALDVLPPDVYLGAVAGIPLVVAAVQRMVAAGHAYQVPGDEQEPDGDVYFSVHADPTFGQIGHLDEARMLEIFADRGGDPDRAGKKHPLDCLLWRVARPGEPSWDGGTLGWGRPGWHIECTTIALEHLGMGFEVQGGGSDLLFPHHEMGASEGHLLSGRTPYAQVYVHAGMVGLDGQKMSKSRGNLVLVSKLRDQGVQPAAIRLALLAHPYRADWDWTQQGLDDATGRLARWRAAAAASDGSGEPELLATVRERLAEDLDSPGALAAVDTWSAAVLAGSAPGGPHGAAGLMPALVDALLGVRLA